MKKQTKHNPIAHEKHLLPQKAYEEYKEIFIKELGHEPSNEELIRGANNLVKLFQLFSEPKVRTLSRQSD